MVIVALDVATRQFTLARNATTCSFNSIDFSNNIFCLTFYLLLTLFRTLLIILLKKNGINVHVEIKYVVNEIDKTVGKYIKLYINRTYVFIHHKRDDLFIHMLKLCIFMQTFNYILIFSAYILML